MKIRGKALTAILMSTVALGTLATAPFAELQAKAQVTKQAKSRRSVPTPTAQKAAAAQASDQADRRDPGAG